MATDTEGNSGQLKKLLAIRGGNRTSITKLERQATALLEELINENGEQVEKVIRLETVQKSLREKQTYVNGLNEKILELCPEVNIEKEIDETTELNFRIDEILGRIQAFKDGRYAQTNAFGVGSGTTQIITSTPSREAENVEQATNNEHGLNTSGVTMGSVAIRLPKITLPRFNGDITRFMSFWQSFENAIDKNESITAVDKLNYLVNLLEGPAYRAVSGLELTEQNYLNAMEILKARFGNKQQIISTHMQALLGLQNCPNENVKQLRFIYDSINVHVRGLEALGMSSASYGSLLVPILMARMPREITLHVARKTTEEVWPIKEILEIVKKEIEARELSDNIKPVEKKCDKTSGYGPKSPQGTTKTFLTKDEKVQDCVYCGHAHSPSSCKEVQEIAGRKKILLETKRCFSCLKSGHMTKKCRENRNCKKCGRNFHHESICYKGAKQTEEETKVTTSVTGKQEVLLQTATAYVYGADKAQRMKINVFFDSGSQRSYISEEVRRKLNLEVERQENLNLNTFGTEKSVRKKCDVVKLMLETGIDETPILISAISYQSICSPINTRIDVSKYQHLIGLNLADKKLSEQNRRIDLLIDTSVGRPVEENEEITQTLREFWKQESSGIDKGSEPTNEDKQDEQFEITFNGKRYQVSLPWKVDISCLNDDYNLALNRLKSLLCRLKGNPELLSEYDNIFKEQLNNGIIEQVPVEEENQGNPHFMSHHGVIRRDRETTKLRVVFDGSAKSHKEALSLNECLELGDNYMPPLFDTLLRFRSHAIAIIADIEKAFLQIEIDEKDRDALRFLWYDDISKPNPTVIQYKYCRLVFGLRPSPSILGATIKKHIAQYANRFPRVVKVLDRLYADDLSCSTNSIDEALEIFHKSREILSEGGFNLRKFKTNDTALLHEIKKVEAGNVSNGDNAKEIIQDDQSFAQQTIGPPQRENNNKVLGVNWESKKDELFFDLGSIIELAKTLKPTKRSLLKLAAKIFDPIGCLSVYTINLKVLFQELCVDKWGWDEELTGEAREKYDRFISEISRLDGIRMPRCFFDPGKIVSQVEIHGFSDASETAYAGIVYLRIVYDTGEVSIKFVTAKARVCPLTKQSIPRLELLGAQLLAKLISTVKGTLGEELHGTPIKVFYWVDSVCTLCWIKNNKVWKQFVRHRVSDILRTSSRDEWFYCPGSQNPADLPSRGIFGRKLEQNLFWWEGPGFLKQPPTKWPKQEDIFESGSALEERVKCSPNITHAIATKENAKVGNVVDFERFGSYQKCVRILAWVLRFIHNLRASLKNNTCQRENQINIEEFANAENVLIRSIQGEFFCKEIDYLQSKGDKKPPLYVSQFQLFVDEKGILRCQSRIKNASVIESSIRPILLPKSHQVSKLLVLYCHEKVMHDGIRETLNLLRQKYWIPRARELVKSIVRKCITCRKLEGLPYSTVFCPDLPRMRVDDQPPFANTGLDFAGPLTVASKGNNDGEEKFYVCLFTCMSTRAVHLELVESLNVESFLRAFRRFAARRGLPSLLVSDNAKTFKSASKDVKHLLRSPRLGESLEKKGVKWQFIVDRSPWQGGAWERLIRSVKRCLKKVIGRSYLTQIELNTILTEVEAVINSRPITYVYDDTDGISYPLTPCQLINGRNLSLLPQDRYYEMLSTYEVLSKRAKYHKTLLQQFTKRWKKEYLTGIMEAYRPKDKREEPVISVGDIVLLKDDDKKRTFWKLCKILELIVGTDGSVRSAKIQIAGERSKGKVFRRPLKLLVPLEIACKEPNTEANQVNAPIAPAQPADRTITRSKRAAAKFGEFLRRDNM
ncbi:uncharacterized protein LOC135689604 [Rhopilema esculentum]|uniref:uncharacterized protein LOC135689604 n=1 Tax=Rhopilema esculentum TaxID=499914 RepID=UPI0031D9DCEB